MYTNIIINTNVIPMGKTGKPFGVSLILHPLIRIIVVDCPLEPITCLTTVLGPDDGDSHGYSYDILATNEPGVMCCQASHYYR